MAGWRWPFWGWFSGWFQEIVKSFTNDLRCRFTVIRFSRIRGLPTLQLYMNRLAFLLTGIALTSSLQIAAAGDITGKVTLKGTPPPAKNIEFDDTCGKLHPTITATRHYMVGA